MENVSNNYDYDKMFVNLLEVGFNTEENELLAKGMKYDSPPEKDEEMIWTFWNILNWWITKMTENLGKN